MALDRLTQITSSGISSTSTITVSAIAGVLTATSATVGSVITMNSSGINAGVVTATNVNVGSAVTIHTGGFRVGSSDLHSTGVSLNNINASGVVTATSFVGNVTGNATGLSGTPNITVGTIGATSLNASGIVTATSFVGNVTGNITGNISGNVTGNVNSTGVSTFATINITQSNPTNLNVSGVSTFAGITTVTGTTLFAKQLNVSGVVTATSFVGDGTNLTNTGSTLSAASGSQRVVLTGQTSGTMTASATDSALTFSQSTGTLSATKFSGDGSALTGIAATTNVRTNSLVVSGVTTATGGVQGNLTGNVTGNLTGNVNASGISTFSAGVIVSAGSVLAPPIAPTGDSDTGIYFPSANTIGISRSGYDAIRIKGNSSTEIDVSLRNQVIVNGTTSGSFSVAGSNEVFKVNSYSQSTSGTDYGSVFMHWENGYKPGNTSYNVYVETRSFGTGHGVYSKTGGLGAAIYAYSTGGPYSEGNGVYARQEHSDSNGPGWQAAVYAFGAGPQSGPVNGPGGTGALHAIVGNHISNSPVIKCESQYSGSPTITAVQFIRNNVNVGNITFTLSGTAYGTTSDHRLKENIVSLENAEERLRQIPVKRFNFIGEPGKIVDGFIAHEVSPYVPEAVTGIKDEMEERIVKDADGKDTFDVDGNPILETVPKYQGIDQSKIVPLLTAALQEAFNKIDDLQDRVAILESS